MPRFYFHLSNPDECIRDDTGYDLVDLAAALGPLPRERSDRRTHRPEQTSEVAPHMSANDPKRTSRGAAPVP
jgi:hypothetical protein